MNRKLSFTITDAPPQARTHTIADLCEYLTDQVLEPIFSREKAPWSRRSMDFFTFDNQCQPLESTGTVLFKIPPYFAGRSGELESAIKRELSKLGIRTGPVVYRRKQKTHEILFIAIPIVENPTALTAPPEVNMSQTRGCVVLRDLLGYEKIKGRYEFAADDLLSRLASVTEERIAACTSSPVKGVHGIRRTPSPASVKSVRRCLDEVAQFAHWAIRHKYRCLAAS